MTVQKTLWLKIAISVILLRHLTDMLVNGLRNDIDYGPIIEYKETYMTFGKIEQVKFKVLKRLYM